jgi:hypothetical protein
MSYVFAPSKNIWKYGTLIYHGINIWGEPDKFGADIGLFLDTGEKTIKINPGTKIRMYDAGSDSFIMGTVVHGSDPDIGIDFDDDTLAEENPHFLKIDKKEFEDKRLMPGEYFFIGGDEDAHLVGYG